MRLDHPELPPFEPILKPITDLVLASGIRALSSVGCRVNDIKENPQALRRFIRGCHYGYDRGQQKIAKVLLDLDKKFRTAQEELKEKRRERDKEGAQALAVLSKVIKNRQLILRRLLDTILFGMIKGQGWILKRFLVQEEIRPFDPRVIARTVQIASQRNGVSRYRFNLVTDLTTIAQIGDLIEVDFTINTEERWRVIELKEGKINELLTGIIGERTEPLSVEERKGIKTSLGLEALKQADRMVRQQKRFSEFWKIVKTDRGLDPITNTEIRMSPVEIFTDTYIEAVRSIVEKAATDGTCMTSVDDSLHLFASAGALLSREGAPAHVRHIFYHMRKPGRDCKAGWFDEAQERAEMESGPPVIDLVSFNAKAQWGCPIFAWELPDNRKFDLVMGRIRVFGCFDLHAFLQMGTALGLKMTWVSGKEGDKFRRFSAWIPGSPKAQAVRVEHPGGHIGHYFAGFFFRAFRDLTTPKQLLELIMRSPGDPQLAQENPTSLAQS